MPGDAVAIVALKRLDDALRQGDQVLAVVRGFGVNNDGSSKAGYVAPSSAGQAGAIKRALRDAGVSADTITYVETHGTGTELGDPIEMEALTEAFRSETPAVGFCAIGSAKTNLGHTNAAAGVTGLVKTVQCLVHQELPASLHFERPNPLLDMASSPFFVNAKLRPWISDGPRRAGVSSFGVGGTNAHLIVEEAPAAHLSTPGRGVELLLLSAASEKSLTGGSANLSQHLASRVSSELADVAHTLQVGRRELAHRRIAVASNLAEASQLLAAPNTAHRHTVTGAAFSVAFLFPGQGSQYPGMAKDLYRGDAFFRSVVDECCQKAQAVAGIDLLSLIYPDAADGESTDENLRLAAQPALFTIEYALARLFMHWGIAPAAMLGHSIGEYAAACVAGVFDLDAALRLVCERNRLVMATAPGAMLAVPLPENEVREILIPGLSLAAVNGPALSVVSGHSEAIEALQSRLASDGLDCQRLRVARAMHSAMMDPILDEFRNCVIAAQPRTPTTSFLSSVTGTWILPEDAASPDHWVRHLREPVRFDAGLRELFQNPEQVLLEVGPGNTLSTLAKRHPQRPASQALVATVRRPQEERNDLAHALDALGSLWLRGAKVDWTAFRERETRRRASLPAYAFDRQRYWIDASPEEVVAEAVAVETPAPAKKTDIADWFYQPVWKEEPALSGSIQQASELTWPVFSDACGLGAALATRLTGARVVMVEGGDSFDKLSDRRYAIDSWDAESYRALFEALKNDDLLPDHILHLGSTGTVDAAESSSSRLSSLDYSEASGFYSLLHVAQAIGGLDQPLEARLCVVSRGIFDVASSGAAAPERATVLGPAKVIPAEYPSLSCMVIELAADAADEIADEILRESMAPMDVPFRMVALRGQSRWTPGHEARRIEAAAAEGLRIRENGVYLITGGLGGIGLTLAGWLAEGAKARLILIGRSGLPPREQWNAASGEIREKINQVRAMEAAGAEVLALAADVTSLPEMQAAVQVAVARFGAIHGAIHAAGVPGGGVIQRKIRSEAASILDPKVRGTLVLDAALNGMPVDFFILCSSLTALIGGFGQADYCAANCFLDAYAQANADTPGRRAQSIGWDGWQQVGMAARAHHLIHERQEVADNALELRNHQPGSPLQNYLTPAEGTEVFRRVLSAGLTQVAISTCALGPRLAGSAAAPAATPTPNGQKMHSRPRLANEYAAPSTPVEEALALHWEQFLGVAPVGVDDDFFALGGDSLLAVQLLTHIRKAMGVNLPPHVLVEASTIARLAARFPQQQACTQKTLPSSLVRLQSGAPGVRPLFLFHPVGGQVYIYRDLVACLDQRIPIWGIQADNDADAGSLQNLAARYLKAVRTVRPHGPYQLGGASFGGTLAYEIAQQLFAAGEVVTLLAMIDAPSPEQAPEGVQDDVEVLCYLLGMRQVEPGLLSVLPQLSVEDQLNYFVERGGETGRRAASLSPKELRGFMRLWRTNLRALREYSARPYPGSAVFFRATVEDGLNRTDYHLGWKSLIPAIETHEIEGTHIEVNLQPRVQSVASVLAPRLNCDPVTNEPLKMKRSAI